MSSSKREFVFKRAPGDNWIWGTGAAMAAVLLMVVVLMGVIVYNGMGYFWPKAVVQYTLTDGTVLAGTLSGKELAETEVVENGQTIVQEIPRVKLKVGNRELHPDFRWVDVEQITEQHHPDEIMVMERMEYGSFYGFLTRMKLETIEVDPALDGVAALDAGLAELRTRYKAVDKIQAKINKLNNRVGKVKDHKLKAMYNGATEDSAEIEAMATEIAQIKVEANALQAEKVGLALELQKNVAVFETAAGKEVEISLLNVVRYYQPNQMGVGAKAWFYLVKIKELLTENPRESNTEGGLFPAIYGTVLMVILMSIFCMPVGVVAAIYLREYAREGAVVRLVRIAVNNLAGVPSIVYGVFGLGFFVYQVGAGIDDIFFPHLVAHNEAKFGTEGLLWASLTLALLTVPVVIVSTEEALAAIPRGMREGSLALGATKWQTIRNVLLPMASPGILTGFILSMARAAGEVAPLMLTGVLKLVEQLPLDGSFPYLHAERKFMHLGFHIYDMGFKSPNVEAALPMVYVTTLLLLFIVILLNITAISLRNRMQKKYTMGAF